MGQAVGVVRLDLLRVADKQIAADIVCRQPARRLLTELVFDQLAGQLPLELLRLLMTRQQHRRLDLHQPRRHVQKLGRHIQIAVLHALDVLHILLEHLCDRDIVNIQFVFLHQMQKQIQRPFKNRQLIGNYIHSM